MKTAVITGGNSGIGKAVAVDLAKQGFRVIIHGRDEAKTKQAVDEIKAESGSKEVESVTADVSSVAGMKKLADAIKAKTNSIEVLVLSTGVILKDRKETVDGLEEGFAIQYLSRFAMVQLLEEELKRGKARIVSTGAPTLKDAQIYFDDIAVKNDFKMMKAMGQEMLAIHLLAQEFAKRHPEKEMTMNVSFAGVVRTGIAREAGFMWKMIVAFGKSAGKAAKVSTWLATDPAANTSGYFYERKPAKAKKIEFDPKVSERLWNVSLDMIKSIR